MFLHGPFPKRIQSNVDRNVAAQLQSIKRRILFRNDFLWFLKLITFTRQDKKFLMPKHTHKQQKKNIRIVDIFYIHLCILLDKILNPSNINLSSLAIYSDKAT